MKLKELNKEQIDRLIVLMRFGKQKKTLASLGCMTYHTIGSIVKKSHEYCRSVCLKYLKEGEADDCRPEIITKAKRIARDNAPERRSKLSQFHFDWIIDEETLKK